MASDMGIIASVDLTAPSLQAARTAASRGTGTSSPGQYPGITRTVMGSVAEAVVRASDRPVYVVGSRQVER